MMLSFRELSVFRSVMELGTITAAAEKLQISQPAVSRMLQQAEQRLGFALFLRRKRRLLATPEASALFPEAVRAFAAFDVVQKRAVDLKTGQAGRLSIAAIAAFANALLPDAIAKFRSTRSDVTISLQAMNALQVATMVANHQADLGLVIDTITVPGVSVRDLCATDFGCVMPRKHSLAMKARLVPSDLEQEPLICLSKHLPLGIRAMRVFDDADVPLKISIEVTQSTVACALVRAKAGLALLDRMGAMGTPGSDLVFRPFFPTTKLTGRLVLPRHQPLSILAREFIDTLRDLVDTQGNTGGRTSKARIAAFRQDAASR